MSLRVGSIWTAIMDRWTGLSELNALGRIWHWSVPQNEQFPYCVFRVLSSEFDPTLKNGNENIPYVELVTMQFLLFDDKSTTDTIDDMLGLIDDNFGADAEQLTLDNYRHDISLREGLVIAHNNEVWQYTLNYRMRFERVFS